MFAIDIPGYGRLELQHFVTDYSGTLSEDGMILDGVKEKLTDLSKLLSIHILTSDTFGKATDQLRGIPCTLHVLEGDDHSKQKEAYVLRLGADNVVALGNGNNDAGMLKAARLGIAVCLREGCSVEAAAVSRILVKSPIDAIDLLLYPKRLMATLRR